jgi:hypothetical protein
MALSAGGHRMKIPTEVQALVQEIARVNKRLSDLSKKKIDVEMDFVNDDDSEADLIDVISIKKRVWEPELVE